jgi:hypothetical protein
MSYVLGVISEHHTSLWNNCIIQLAELLSGCFPARHGSGTAGRSFGPIEHVPVANTTDRSAAVYSSS